MKLNGLKICYFVLLTILSLSPEVMGDIIHPAYLEMKETEPGRFDIVWKVPRRYNVQIPIEPVFPDYCSWLSDISREVFPDAVVQRWVLDSGPSGLEGATIEITGLQVTIMDVLVRIEMRDGRVYSELLRGANPRYTVSRRTPPAKILGYHLVFGMKQAVRQLPVILLVFTLVLFAGMGRVVPTVLVAFAAGYAGAFVGHAFGLIGAASQWGGFAVGLMGFLLVTRTLRNKNGTDSPSGMMFWFLLLGIVFGAAPGGDWNRGGLAYLDMPLAAAALVGGTWLGLLLLAGIPILASIINRDFNIGKPKLVAAVPTYALGALSVFLLLQAITKMVPLGMVQPYLRPESIVLALGAGMWIGWTGRTRALGLSALFLCAGLAGLGMGTKGVPLPWVSVAVPLSLAVTGITLMFYRRYPLLLELAIVGFCGLFHGWINGNWLAEHVSTSLPSAVGEIVLLAGILFLGIRLRRRVAPQWKGALEYLSGLGLVAVSFAIRFMGYSPSAFKEISVSAASGIRIPVISVILLAGALLMISMALKRPEGVRASRFALPLCLLVIVSLIVLPYGSFALTARSGSLGELTDNEARNLIASLLENTYRAVNLREEEEIYDRLAMSVQGDLVERLYLESRRRAVTPGQADAEAKLIGVNVVEITDGSPTPDGSGYSFTCRWLVTGTIRHWAHKHNRLNRYAGILTIRVVDGVWKISGFELLDEERLKSM